MKFEGKNFSFDLGKRTYVMGILNVTPDSFSDGGLWLDADAAARHALEMQAAGADLLDIGAQSTRPGHTPVEPEEEIRRLLPVLERLRGTLTIPISVDTYYPRVARAALRGGAAIVNDVSGVVTPDMAEVVREERAGWIVMHTGGGDSSNVPSYPNDDIVAAVREFFLGVSARTKDLGLPKEAICLDPGIGFGKTHAHNLTLLRETARIRLPDHAFLTAASRKRVVGLACNEPDAAKRLAGTLAAHTIAIAGGTDFVRVHDVAESVQAARMADAIYRR